MVFPPSRSPALLTAPGDGFAQPFTLSPGKWNLHIRAEGVLLVRQQNRTAPSRQQSSGTQAFITYKL